MNHRLKVLFYIQVLTIRSDVFTLEVNKIAAQRRKMLVKEMRTLSELSGSLFHLRKETCTTLDTIIEV